MQPIRISGNRSGKVVLPDEPCHDTARMIREALKTFAAPSPPCDEWHLFERLLLERGVARAPCGLFAAEVLLELRYQVEGGYLVLFAAWSMHCSIVHFSILSSMSFEIELKNATLPDRLRLGQVVYVLRLPVWNCSLWCNMARRALSSTAASWLTSTLSRNVFMTSCSERQRTRIGSPEPAVPP